MSTPNNGMQTIHAMANFMAEQHPEILLIMAQKLRLHLSNSLASFHGNRVAHGPFKGLLLGADTHWGEGADRGGMILGLYEQEILNIVDEIPARYRTFIDLGAADGYYGLGMLVNNRFHTSYCYEITERGREVIAANAVLNGVADRVIIRGEATREFYNDLPAEVRDQSLVLVDIEGAEFDLIDAGTFAAFSKAMIVIEIHDWMVENGPEKMAKLQVDAARTHRVTEIKMGARDLSGIPELQSMPDTQRWLLCSENRARVMVWLRFDPIEMDDTPDA
ncbi:hypothetical protein [uncultured Agrobacterium sp.]|uniref:hypothetical protein n=1 Tax=uncultured Agrobacterium sp. TaxID=157277 RepID=UPI0025E25920|nr:hypothetical protein [uncultured Agrobacterium sp.]